MLCDITMDVKINGRPVVVYGPVRDRDTGIEEGTGIEIERRRNVNATIVCGELRSWTI